jgi:predicted SAM-dependent methyltransferase
MTDDSSSPRWRWEDPDEFSRKAAQVHADHGRCARLEPIAVATPLFTRADLVTLPVTGIEFGTLATNHPTGLAADLVHLHADSVHTEPGRLYRVDDTRYFAQVDVTAPLPFDTGCVDWVYAEHLIEHVKPGAAIAWLTEVKRILSDGGLLRLTTPDFRKYAECYLHGGEFFVEHRRRMNSMTGAEPAMPTRPGFMFNQIFYLYGHRWIYDADELRHALLSAGFAADEIAVRAFREGALPDVAQLDGSFRNDETIYVEATR